MGISLPFFWIVSFDFNWSRSPKIRHPSALVCPCGLADIRRFIGTEIANQSDVIAIFSSNKSLSNIEEYKQKFVFFTKLKIERKVQSVANLSGTLPFVDSVVSIWNFVRYLTVSAPRKWLRSMKWSYIWAAEKDIKTWLMIAVIHTTQHSDLSQLRSGQVVSSRMSLSNV